MPKQSYWDQLIAVGRRRRVAKGLLLVQEGEPGGQLFLVLSGRLRAYSRDDEGHEVTYGMSGAGDIIGEMSLDGGPRSANVIAEADSEVVIIEGDALREFVGENGKFALELIGRIIARARVAMHSTRNMALLDVYGRLVEVLDEIAGPPAADGSRACTPLSQVAIASRVGCSREMISRLLRDLAQGGFIEARRKQIVIRKKLPARW